MSPLLLLMAVTLAGLSPLSPPARPPEPVSSEAVVPSVAASEAVVPLGPSRYFFTLFAGQSVPFRPRTAHTWATWTKVTPTNAGLLVEPITISWLPTTGLVRPFWPFAVPGKNWSLEETLAIMGAYNSRISRWGPYEVTAEQYAYALRQYLFLEAGGARYRVIDSFNTNRRVVNCVHAVTHAAPYLGNRVQPVIRVGEPGTSRLAKIFLRRGALPGYPVRHDWALEASGGGSYPMVPREPGQRIPRQFFR